MTDQPGNPSPLTETIARTLHLSSQAREQSSTWAELPEDGRTLYRLMAAAVIAHLQLRTETTDMPHLDGSGIRSHSITGEWSEWIEAGR